MTRLALPTQSAGDAHQLGPPVRRRTCAPKAVVSATPGPRTRRGRPHLGLRPSVTGEREPGRDREERVVRAQPRAPAIRGVGGKAGHDLVEGEGRAADDLARTRLDPEPVEAAAEARLGLPFEPDRGSRRRGPGETRQAVLEARPDLETGRRVRPAEHRDRRQPAESTLLWREDPAPATLVAEVDEGAALVALSVVVEVRADDDVGVAVPVH